MSEAIQAGISRKTLYAMLEAGAVERLSRGVYRLTSLPSLETPDLVAAAARIMLLIATNGSSASRLVQQAGNPRRRPS